MLLACEQIHLDMKRFVGYALVLIVGFVSFVAAQSPVPRNATVEMVASGFQFVEGPVWKDGVGLLFSDIPADKVYLWAPGVGVSIFRSPSGNSNGLTFDAQGRLVVTQTGNRRIARIESTGLETVLAATYSGKKFNSPNDVVVKSDGSIFIYGSSIQHPGGPESGTRFLRHLSNWSEWIFTAP
jgi:gluconolactonase